MSFRQKVVVCVSILLTILVVALVGVSYNGTKNVITKMTEASSTLLIKQVDKKIETWYGLKAQLLDAMQSVLSGHDRQKNIEVIKATNDKGKFVATYYALATTGCLMQATMRKQESGTKKPKEKTDRSLRNFTSMRRLKS